MTQPPARPAAGRWDHLLLELTALRRAHGEPSFGEIARRISEARSGSGASEHAARVARSTVHDSFRLGRSRINVALVREIVQALGGDAAVVDQWLAASGRDASPAPPGAGPLPGPAPLPPPDPAPVARETRPVPLGPGSRPSRSHVVLLVLGCIGVNVLGRVFVDFFHLPLYLDMVGTAVAALALGPWRGAGVGVATNVVGVVGSGAISLPFALVNAAGALVWGYGSRRWGLGRSLPRFLALDVLAALACSAVAIPILLANDGASFRDGHGVIVQIVRDAIGTPLLAVGVANVMTSVADKLLSGFVALVAVSALPLGMRTALPFVVVATGPAARPDVHG